MYLKNIRYIAKKIGKQFKLDEDSKAESGIGVLIIFIALVLVAAVAASVLIHTAGILQQKADATGTTTTNQVSSGLIINAIIGYDSGNPPESGGVQYVAILLQDNAGGSAINLANASLTITMNSATALLVYNSSLFSNVSKNGIDNLFKDPVFQNMSAKKNDQTNFGVISVIDPTNAITGAYPVITIGDEAALVFNVTNTFGSNITQNMVVSGEITPEVGATSQIQFTAPIAFTSSVVTLQN
jgi:flagellin FlaB